MSERRRSARQRLDALKADPKWFHKLMAGDSEATVEYERLNHDLAG
jgi:hypothetical protein